MGRKVSVLTFNEEESKLLESFVRSRTAQAQVSTRARILLLKADGKKIDKIADKVGLNRKDELEERIYAYFEEVNAVPVVYHWKYKLSEIDQNEPVKVDVLPIPDHKKSS